MACPSSTSKTQTLNSSSTYLESLKSFSQQSPQPLTFPQHPLPPIPTNLPQPKLIPNTRFIIDGFQHSGNYSISYFLSHFHSDHYVGLTPLWSKGLIFCSKITAQLLIEVLKVSPLFVVSLALRETVSIDGCEVTLIDANHCPGAVQFLFKIPGINSKDKKFIHTGDFRFSNSMKSEFLLNEFVGSDAIFLDTTYCNPKFVFPPQVDSVNYVVDTIKRIRVENYGSKKNVLFLIATYVIGKEKILLEISQKCGCMIHVDTRKMGVLRVLGFGESGIFTEDASATDVHVVGWNVLGETWPYFRPNFSKMKELMMERGYSRTVGFVPTGWMYEVKREGFAVRTKDCLEIHLVPYSEHSSYEELREYVRFLKPKRVIPTVGMDIDKLDGKHVIAMQKHFAGLVDEMANKQEFLMGFQRLSEKNDFSTDFNEESENLKEAEPMKTLSDTPGNTTIVDSAVRDMKVLDDKDREEMIEELKVCLPIWATRDQMLDLLTKSGGNIVEAASEFYEHETEFHEQVRASNMHMTPCKMPTKTDSVVSSEPSTEDTTHQSSANILSQSTTELHEQVSASNTHMALSKMPPKTESVVLSKPSTRDTTHQSSADILSQSTTEFDEQVSASNTHMVPCKMPTKADSIVLSKPSTKDATHQSSANILSQNKKFAGIKQSTKGTVSPKKRVSVSDRVSKKKVKSSSSVESTGSKQPTITKFFTKLEPNASQGSSGPKQSTITKFLNKLAPSNSEINKTSSYPMAEESEINAKPLSSDIAEPYKEHLDQFLQVTGDSVSRSEAASILEKAKGDLNVALNTYCTSSVGTLDDKGELPFYSKTVQIQSSADNCSLENQKQSSEETKNAPSLAVQGSSSENVAATHVLLPLEKYSPVEHACWRSGQPAPYLHLARTFDLVEGERGKIKATGMLCNMFRSLLALSPQDVLPAVYLCTHKIAPDHVNMELNIGGSMVTAALEEACGTNKTKIREMYNNFGDLGDVAQVCRQTQTLIAPPSALTVLEVFSALRKISSETGKGSTIRKKSLIARLMRSCREKEMKFLVRTLVRNLRIGAMMRTILPALAQAVVIQSCPTLLHGPAEILKEKLQSISTEVVEAYNVVPDLDLLIPSLISEGVDFSSTTLSMIPGIPVRPMLARITNGVSQALKQFKGRAFTCEYKYDGQRAQIHKLDDGSLKIFSRNGDETTFKFPDLVNVIKESCKPEAMTFIVDAEVVAVDRKNGCKLMSFQELSSRERGSKSSLITMDNIKVDICVFIFDIMFANGERLLDLPLRQRRECLKKLFCEEKVGYFEYAKELTVEAEDASLSSPEVLPRISSFLEDAFNSSCEGIMVKSLDVDAIYAASKRTDTWLKVKRDYLEGMNDSLDLVPIGAWYGNGRKAKWYSPFLMACYNPDTEEYQSACRVMSGFSDLFYAEMKEYFSGERILSKKPPYYQTAEVPDKWFSPELVWEIRGADFTISPVHHAGIGLIHPSRGISIRFPRFIRSLSDRRAEDCSTAADVADMFQSQTRKKDVSVGD